MNRASFTNTFTPSISTYRELLSRRDAPPGSAWGCFGSNDDLGTINALSPERVLDGVRLVRRGDVFNLDYPINAFGAGLHRARRPARHRMFSSAPQSRDDFLESFYLQGSSHIDGLRHRRHLDHGFYDGAPDDTVAEGTDRLGIHHWAEHGIVGRAVLLDVDRLLRERRGSLDHGHGEAFSADLLDDAARAQEVELRQGDIVLIHTGWARFYLDTLADGRAPAAGDVVASSGLIQSHRTLEWFWDQGLAFVASDNMAVEAVPAVPESPFDQRDGGGLMHQELIALLGIALGEMWRLSDLALDCERDGVYECLVVSKPLNLVGGIGSPANAIAIK